MASAGDAFPWCPENIPVKPLTPEVAIIRTETESFKVQRQLIDPTQLEKFELDFGEILNTGVTTCRNSIRAHYIAQNHDYSSFSWTGVPSYISATPITVRYEGYEEEPVPRSNGTIWNVKLTFRKEV